MSWADTFRPDYFLLVSAAATAFFAFVTLWQALLVRDPTARRLQKLAAYQDGLKTASRSGRRHSTRANIAESTLPFMRRTVLKLNLMRGRQVDRISLRLARAGWRSRDAITIYLFCKAVLPLVLSLAGFLYFALFGSAAHLALRYLCLMLGLCGGVFGTDIFVRNAGDKRIHRMNNALPDALDLLVICAEGGLSLDASVQRVSRELAGAAPDLADEFSLTAVELGFLPDRQMALQNLGRRTDMPRLRGLVNSLAQTERYGTPLANTLRVLAAEFRDERMMRAEEKAAKLPAILTVPMILFILPALFIVLCGPVALRIADLIAHH